jgi:hypothetical protein
MEPVARIFASFEEAEEAEREFYGSLTPEQRSGMLLELLEFTWPETDGSPPRLERVSRIAEFPPR